MSAHIALQRLIVRLRYDPAWVALLARDAEAALRGTGLGEEARSWLVAVDRRAWNLDPLRRARRLHALCEEYPATVAVWRQAGQDAAALETFFSSARFHGAIQAGDPLVIAFGGFVRQAASALPVARAVAGLERAIAQARRSQREATEVGWTLGRGVEVVALPAGTLGRYAAVIGALSAGAASEPPSPTWLLEGAVGARPLTLPSGLGGALGADQEFVLVEVSRVGGAAVSAVSEPLFRFLDAARGAEEKALVDVVTGEGGSHEDALELLSELQRDGLLRGPQVRG